MFHGLTSGTRKPPASCWGFSLGTGLTGLEPATSAVTGQCSNQLNYSPLLSELYYNAIFLSLSTLFFEFFRWRGGGAIARMGVAMQNPGLGSDRAGFENQIRTPAEQHQTEQMNRPVGDRKPPDQTNGSTNRRQHLINIVGNPSMQPNITQGNQQQNEGQEGECHSEHL